MYNLVVINLLAQNKIISFSFQAMIERFHHKTSSFSSMPSFGKKKKNQKIKKAIYNYIGFYKILSMI